MELIKIDISCSLCNMGEILYVIDGSNVAFEQRNSKNRPKLSNLILLIKSLKSLGINNLKIICDRSLYYCIDDQDGLSQLKNNGLLIESPEGTESDIFILQYAFLKDGYIISNDKYRDFFSIFDQKWVENRRISFKIIDDVFCFNKIIFIGGENNGQKTL